MRNIWPVHNTCMQIFFTVEVCAYWHGQFMKKLVLMSLCCYVSYNSHFRSDLINKCLEYIVC
jgi:hypothetical protein